jgi:hypothetical protein
MPAKRVRAERRCSYCSKVRYNTCTCKVEIEDIVGRLTSEKETTVTITMNAFWFDDV